MKIASNHMGIKYIYINSQIKVTRSCNTWNITNIDRESSSEVEEDIENQTVYLNEKIATSEIDTKEQL